ncbi:hypothetical protein EC9_09670 [Rosistilla ulvae]|uniref:Uncharacterized protein n=1 Tax=Rosistilla ulvae TaxID=1930277 RepID=A0A517LVZ2_9BACT|nr:hypothetical protein [Rosistilla ulvae]QDS86793.1 hypothetical protein EC9_09670 [Rosistilla ulvae]
MKTKLTVVVLAFACVAALGASNASAQGYGHGMFYHSEAGARGAAGHYTYGDYYSNHRHARGHVGVRSPALNTSPFGYRVNAARVLSTNATPASGHRFGDLYPGMVLPDGAVVVSVGK